MSSHSHDRCQEVKRLSKARDDDDDDDDDESCISVWATYEVEEIKQ